MQPGGGRVHQRNNCGVKAVSEPVCLGLEAPGSPPRSWSGKEPVGRFREGIHNIVRSAERMLPVNVLNLRT